MLRAGDESVNGAEFFMRHAGYRLLPQDRQTGDAVTDADCLLGLALPLNTGKTLRLSSCWMIVTPTWVATSFKALPSCGFRQDVEMAAARLDALRSGEPCMLLKLGKRTAAARDLFVTYDPRATRVCDAGHVETFDATRKPWWIS
jgi:hypothetical protein